MDKKTEEKSRRLIITCTGFIVLMQGACLASVVLPDIIKAIAGLFLMVIGLLLELSPPNWKLPF